MRKRNGPPVLLLIVIVAQALTGCAWLREPSPPSDGAPPRAVPAPVQPAPPAPSPPPPPAVKPPPAPAPPAPAPVPKPPPASAADNAFSLGMTALQEGAYERALEHFSAAWKAEPGYPGASEKFDEALVALKRSGDLAHTQGKPEEAGKRWMGTLRNLNSPVAKGRKYAFSSSDVQGQVDRLTAGLMEKGLLNYRKGDIPAAIAAWKAILSYDPENEEAARSIRTASKQLENLKKIPPTK